MPVKSEEDALKEIPKLNNILKEAGDESKEIKKAVDGSSPTVNEIKTAANGALKSVSEWNQTIASARKLQTLLDKEKSAAATAKSLRDATEKAEKAISNVKNEADIANKLADKSEKEDAALGTNLTKLIPAAEKSQQELKSALIGGTGMDLLADNLTKINAGTLPPQALANSAPVVSEKLKSLGANITTAESVKSSISPIAKQALDAYIPEVKKQGMAATGLDKELTELIAKARTLLNKELGEMKMYQDKIKLFATEDIGEIKVLSSWAEKATAATAKLKSYLISGEGSMKLLQNNLTQALAGKLPAAALKSSIPVVQKQMKVTSDDLANAEGVKKSMEPIVTDNLTSVVPVIQKQAVAAQQALKELTAAINQTKTELNKDVAEIKTIETKANTLK